MLVAIVNDKLSAALTQQHDVENVAHLDVEGFRFAGRIDITGWLNQDDRYIGFIKGKGKVAEYFQTFLGCDDSIPVKRETLRLVSALEGFTDESEMGFTEKTQFLAKAKDICAAHATNREQISFEFLANSLMPAGPQALLDYLTDPERRLSDNFVPNKMALNRLVKFSGQRPNWTLEFDREALVSGEVEHIAEENSLLIRNIPDELTEKITRELGDG